MREIKLGHRASTSSELSLAGRWNCGKGKRRKGEENEF